MKRVIIGRRSLSNPIKGIFISPPGVDAETAADDDLTLNISDNVNQLLSLGYVTSDITLPLGLSRTPLVFLTSRFDLSPYYGYGFVQGPIRPSPYASTNAVLVGETVYYVAAPACSTATVNANGASVTFDVEVRTDYAIYRNALT